MVNLAGAAANRAEPDAPARTGAQRGPPWRRPARLRLVGQHGVEQLQLGADGLEVAERVAAGAVDHVHQHARALAVPQELVAQPAPRVRALQQPCAARRRSPPARLLAPGRGRAPPAHHLCDKRHPRRTRDVRKDGGAEVQLADAQVGHERGERVVGHLGPRGRHRSCQGVTVTSVWLALAVEPHAACSRRRVTRSVLADAGSASAPQGPLPGARRRGQRRAGGDGGRAGQRAGLLRAVSGGGRSRGRSRPGAAGEAAAGAGRLAPRTRPGHRRTCKL